LEAVAAMITNRSHVDMNNSSPDEWLDRAFRLSFFLHGDRDTAVRIVAGAMNKLQLAASSQGKRLYYRLTGRGNSRKSRSKVSLSTPHLLQRLVYVESEPYELEKEAQLQRSSQPGARRARRSDLVVYFIKHLVRITTRRNSFYVTLGMSRLLYNYTTPETMELYNLVIQDPERVHDDYYYRSRKGVLLKELKERFGQLLEVTKGVRGEQRWRSLGDGDGYHELVQECLQWFTPWSTPCVVPERFDPFADTIEKLNFDGRLPDEEHEVEVNRIHAALHPECFARLAAANKLDKPDERLELPHFQLTDDDEDDGGSSSRTPPPINDAELAAINDLLAQEAVRRKAASAGLFRVLVDGQERAGIDSASSASAQFSVDDGAEVIEVYSADKQGPLLLATHLLDFAGPESQTSAITLERGQRFSFTTNLSAQDSEGVKSARVKVSYEERSPGFTVLAAEAWTAIVNGSRDLLGAASSSWKPVTAVAILALLAISTWWTWSRLARTTPESVVRYSPTPIPLNPAPPPPLGPAPNGAEQAKHLPPNQPAPRPVKRPSVRRAEPDETFVARTIVPDAGTGNTEPDASRSWDRGVMGKPLKEVSQILVQAVNQNDQSNDLLMLLRDRLSAGSGLSNSEAEKADAALKISVRSASARADERRIIAIVRVVNANGYVVWPASSRGSSWRYMGSPAYVADRVIADLKRDIARSQTR
jgi:hypothetical protein